MTKMFFSSQGCRGATSEATGKTYNADRHGFVHVEDSRDIKALESGGYVQVNAGGTPRVRAYYVCACGWEAYINSCPKCDRTDLTRVAR